MVRGELMSDACHVPLCWSFTATVLEPTTLVSESLWLQDLGCLHLGCGGGRVLDCPCAQGGGVPTSLESGLPQGRSQVANGPSWLLVIKGAPAVRVP